MDRWDEVAAAHVKVVRTNQDGKVVEQGGEPWVELFGLWQLDINSRVEKTAERVRSALAGLLRSASGKSGCVVPATRVRSLRLADVRRRIGAQIHELWRHTKHVRSLSFLLRNDSTFEVMKEKRAAFEAYAKAREADLERRLARVDRIAVAWGLEERRG